MSLENVGVAILTYNAERWVAEQIAGLSITGIRPDQVLVVDSSSKDRTEALFRAYGASVLTIPQASFNHGGTRRLASEHLSSRDVIVFMTQDAIPADADCIQALVRPFEDETVGMVYGRQLPRSNADPIEAHARLFNYPESNHRISFEDKQRIGSKATFASDSFSAYRMKALKDVGGFPDDAFFAEDQIVAARMLMKGYAKAYAGDARVHHSHRYTVVEDFKRYFDVGVFHARNRWLTESFGRPENEGKRFVMSEIRYLARLAPHRIPDAMIRTIVKYIGYRIGKMEGRLSPQVKQKLSSSPYYWLTH